VTELSIGEVVTRTGVAEATLRVWERRHGFPAPQRLPGGHRRYSERDVDLIRRVAAERDAGVALPVAIARAREEAELPTGSVFAALRRRRPDLEARTLPKHQMIALSHAIEDESLSRAERPLLFASFQRERFYRQAEARWRELSKAAALAVVFADFKRVRLPRGAPAEVPLRRSDPLLREWSVVCEAEGHAACLAGWEPPGSGNDGRERTFEAIWSVEPDVVREAARICAEIAAAVRPALVEPARSRLDSHPPRPAADQLKLATAITARTLAYLAGGGPGS
jgi:DICT domain-containing protein